MLKMVSAWALVWLLVSSPIAFAQTLEEEEQMSEARALFLAGRVAFEEGHFEAALHHFEASYELSGRPGLLYNIGQSHDRMRHDAEAIDAFERYLAADPEAENRPAVQARLEALRVALAEREAGRQTVSSPRPVEAAQVQVRDDARSTPLPIGPSVVIGTGALATITGGVLMWLGHRGGNDVEHADAGASYGGLQNDLEHAERQWVAGQALLGAGVVAAGAGVLWLVLDRHEAQGALRLGFMPRGVQLGGRF